MQLVKIKFFDTNITFSGAIKMGSRHFQIIQDWFSEFMD